MQELQSGQTKILERIPAFTFIDKENYNSITRVFGYKQKPTENHTPENQSKQKATSKKPYRVLLAEDDKEMRTLLACTLRSAGYKVVECPNGWNLIDQIDYQLFLAKRPNGIDIIVSDIRMPGPSGIEVLRDMGNTKGFPPMILITAFGDNKTHALAALLGAAAIFDKPFDVDELPTKIHEILSGKSKHM